MNSAPDHDLELLRVPDLPWPVQLADGCATDAALAAVTALGAIAAVDGCRAADPTTRRPAPGISALPAEIRGHALDAARGAARVHALGGTVDPAAQAAVDQALARAQDASLAARRALRRLAQVGLGVAQHAADTETAELVTRALVGVLVHDPTDTTAAGDAFPLVGRGPDEVAVELAGLVARMLCEAADRRSSASFAVVADGCDPVVVHVSDDGAVRVDDAVIANPIDLVLARVGTAGTPMLRFDVP